MELTVVGVVIAALSLLIVLFLPRSALRFVFFTSLLGAASVVNLPALGDTSVPPGYFALSTLGLALLRLRLSWAEIVRGIQANGPLVLFASCAAFGAFLLPRMFEGAFEVVPMAFKGDYSTFYSMPLAPNVRNISQAVYITGTTAAAVLASIAARRAGGSADQLGKFILWMGLLTALLGFIDLIGYSLGADRIFDVVRNGNYSQTSQAEGGFRRVAATFNEASTYAIYAMTFLVFAAECWLRGLRPRLSAAAAAALALILLLSTSSSAYAGLAIYGAILLIRLVFLPSSVGPRIPALLATGVAGMVGAVALVALTPGLATSLLDLLTSMTVGKGNSLSGIQRGFWAQQAYQAFWSSFGLGAGVGSLRSSSYALAVLGSTGLIGASLMLYYLGKVLPISSWSTYSVHQTGSKAYGIAAGWAAVIGLGPALVSGASADPGLVFGLFAGLAISWRSLADGAKARRASRAAYVRQSWRLGPTAAHPSRKGGLDG